MEFTGERYVPSLKGQIYYEHLHRYAIAARFAAGKRVLDVACGEGYGSALLARTAAEVVGVDIDEHTVAHARRTYYAANLRFLQGAVTRIPVADGSFDVVASFETIEHLAEHELMLDEIRRVLRPGGVVVLSSPNKLVYSDLPSFTNPYHVKELYFSEFRDLLTRRFEHVGIYGQRLAASSFVHPLAGAVSAGAGWYSGGADRLESVLPTLRAPTYFLAICSDDAVPPDVCSSYLDSDDDLLEDIWAELNELRQFHRGILAGGPESLPEEPIHALAEDASAADAPPSPTLEEQQAVHDEEVATLRAGHDAEIARLRADHDAEIVRLRVEFDSALEHLRAEHAAAAAESADARRMELARHDDEHQGELARLIAEHQTEREDVRRSYDAQAAQARAVFDAEIARSTREARECAANAATLAQALEDLRREMHRTREAVLLAEAEVLDERARASSAAREVAELRAVLEAGERRAEAAEAERAVALSEIAAANERTAQLSAALEITHHDSELLREVLSSRSWKLTLPLRRAVKLVRR